MYVCVFAYIFKKQREKKSKTFKYRSKEATELGMDVIFPQIYLI